MEQGRAERFGVEPQPGADLRDLDRVGDEVLAGTPALIRVAVAGERKCLLDGAPVELRGALVGVLRDDGEQVAKERPLVVRQVLGVLVVDDSDDCRVLVRADAGVPAGLGRQRERFVGDEVAVLPVAGYAAAGIGFELCSLPLVRNCKHSS